MEIVPSGIRLGFEMPSGTGSLRVRGGAAACDPRAWGGFASGRARSRARSRVLVARARGISLPDAAVVAFFNPPRASNLLNLDDIRKSLRIQEHAILYNLLERSEFLLNPEGHRPEVSKICGFSGTLVEFIMQETEKAHAKAGRYKNQGELPFFGEMLLEPVLPLVEYSEVLDSYAATINLNKVIWDLYFDKILPKLAKKGSDGNTGLSSVCDTKTLQAISKRVHHSMFLAEALFKDNPELFEPMIKEQDIEKLRRLIIHYEMEESNLRVQNWVEIFGLLVNQGQQLKIKIDLFHQLFVDYIIPLIVEVQVQYLLLKGRDDNESSSAVRKIVRLKALSKTTQLLVRAGPSLAYFAKVVAILTLALMIAAKEKIIEILNAKGLVPDKTALALLVLCSVTVKGAYDTLKKGKEVTDLAKYYTKLLKKDKEEP